MLMRSEHSFKRVSDMQRGKNMEVAFVSTRPGSQNTKLDLDSRGYPTGKEGIIWGTYDLRQAETIRNALVAQHIGCELVDEMDDRTMMYLLRVNGKRDSVEATDFVWKASAGLRLKPDWSYPEGKINESFEQWLSGH